MKQSQPLMLSLPVPSGSGSAAQRRAPVGPVAALAALRAVPVDCSPIAVRAWNELPDEAVIIGLQHADAAVRMLALLEISRRRISEAVPALRILLERGESHPQNQVEAIAVLIALSDDKKADAQLLGKVAATSHFYVGDALGTFLNLGDHAADALVVALRNPDASVQEEILTLLKNVARLYPAAVSEAIATSLSEEVAGQPLPHRAVLLKVREQADRRVAALHEAPVVVVGESGLPQFKITIPGEGFPDALPAWAVQERFFDSDRSPSRKRKVNETYLKDCADIEGRSTLSKKEAELVAPIIQAIGGYLKQECLRLEVPVPAGLIGPFLSSFSGKNRRGEASAFLPIFTIHQKYATGLGTLEAQRVMAHEIWHAARLVGVIRRGWSMSRPLYDSCQADVRCKALRAEICAFHRRLGVKEGMRASPDMPKDPSGQTS